MDSKPTHFYQLSDRDLMDNHEIPMSNYKGKVCLVVNVSSKCGLTDSNYKELVKLDEKYRDQGLTILAFPCNQFASQEPGTKEEIRELADKYNVKFQMFEKANVNGSDARPVFAFLQNKLTGTLMNMIKWNFTKFLLDRDGTPIKRYGPKENPLSFEDKIVQLLEKPAASTDQPQSTL